MNISGIRPGDLVKIDRKGRIFHAEAVRIEGRTLHIAPLQRGITFRTATAREVVAHWRKAGRTRKKEAL